MIRTFVLITVVAMRMATVYGESYVGRPLFCDRGQGLVYGDATEPWVALPVSEYGITWECGDLIYVGGTDATGEPWSLTARALDAGPLAKYCIEVDEQCMPIAVDIPEPLAPFPGLSARVSWLVNISAMARQWREMGAP